MIIQTPRTGGEVLCTAVAQSLRDIVDRTMRTPEKSMPGIASDGDRAAKDEIRLPWPCVDPQSVGLSGDRLTRLSEVLREHVRHGRLPGAVGIVARRGQVAWFDVIGSQDPGRDLPMRADSIFRIFSMTKPIVSVAALMLVEQGLLNLSDPVARWIPAFCDQRVATVKGDMLEWQALTRAATVHDLLRHTAGLTYEFLETGPVQAMYLQARLGARGRVLAEEVDALAALPLVCAPGERWQYSRATDVLGRVIEVVTGMSLARYLAHTIFEPLGMCDTGFEVADDAHDRIAEPFSNDPQSGVPVKLFDAHRAPVLQSGGGGLLSTAADYHRFVQMLACGGAFDGVRLLSRTSVQWMACDHLGSIPHDSAVLPSGYGFGLGVAVRKSSGVCATPGSAGLFYWGGIAGTTFWVDPVEELTAVLMIQAPAQRDLYRDLFRQLVYAAVID
jgi:CubicO group peptidase (beta-lactamase class C family)